MADFYKNKNHWTRRDFLKTLSLALAVMPLRPVLSLPQAGTAKFFSRQKTARTQKVIVIGAGLAGLTVAYELTKAGHDVTILEARNRAGGRIFTVREFADGLHAECGAEWIEHTHDYLFRYIEEFGLSLYRGRFVDTEDEGLQFSPRARQTLFDFTQLTIIYSWFLMSSYILLYANVWAMRRTHAEMQRPFKIPFGKPGLFLAMLPTCVMALVAMGSTVFEDGTFSRRQFVIGTLSLLSGPVVYGVVIWLKRQAWAGKYFAK